MTGSGGEKGPLLEVTAAAMWTAVHGRTWDDCPYQDTWRKRAQQVLDAQSAGGES